MLPPGGSRPTGDIQGFRIPAQQRPPATPNRLHCAKPPTNNDGSRAVSYGDHRLPEKPTKVERTALKLAALSFNNPRAVIGNSQVRDALLVAACRRCKKQSGHAATPHPLRLLRHGAVRVIGVYPFRRFDIKTSKRFSSTYTN